MFDYKCFMGELLKLENGKPRIDYIKANIPGADRAGMKDEGMDLRCLLMNESACYHDGYDCVVNFPEYMTRMDEFDIAEAGKYAKDFMRSFGQYLNVSSGYYQIVKKTTDELWNEYKLRCKKYGFSLRSYYMHKIRLCDSNAVLPRLLELFRKEKRDELSAGRMFESYIEINAELKLGNVKSALEHYEIFREFACNENLFQSLDINFACYYHNRKQYKKAKPYVIKAYEYLLKNPDETDYICTIITLCKGIDVEFAFEAWKALIIRVLDTKNPADKYYVFKATAVLFTHLHLKGIDIIKFHDFPESFPLYRKAGLYLTQKIHNWFYDEAMSLAEKFDLKDESDDYTEGLKRFNMYNK
jgi:outer membrane protein assembly factor BamD (BamD/ComL family)